MTIPPKEDGLAARMDPTRARPRKFNTGKGARVPNHGDGIDASWTETPEEKRKRLADKVLGVEDRSASSTAARSNKQDERDVDTARKIREHNVGQEPPSLSFVSFHSLETNAMSRKNHGANRFTKSIITR